MHIRKQLLRLCNMALVSYLFPGPVTSAPGQEIDTAGSPATYPYYKNGDDHTLLNGGSFDEATAIIGNNDSGVHDILPGNGCTIVGVIGGREKNKSQNAAGGGAL